MSNLPDNLYTASQTRELDRLASRHHGLSPQLLMERAGQAALTLLQQAWPKAKHLLILAGTGNNGGDGFEVARQAKQYGLKVTVIQIGDDSALAPTAAEAKKAMQAADVNTTPFETALPDADLIIDSLFGTGLNRPLEATMHTAIEAINNHSSPTLSFDIPSGLHADTGHILGNVVKADKTLSFIGLNLGLYTGEGPAYTGQIHFHDLGVPNDVYGLLEPIAQQTRLKEYAQFLSPRHRTSHKGHFGHQLVIGGDHGMSGAIRLAGELMCHAIKAPEELRPLLQAASVITIGPGLGQNDWGSMLFEQSIQSNKPLVLDADALNLLAQNPMQNEQWVLTPHPGEAARLLNCSSADIQSDRVQAITTLQQRYGGIIVLKGAGTLMTNGQSMLKLSPYGNPGMATGGMGDVLSGIIGSLIAQGCSLFEAACLGVTLHGRAADKAAKEKGERGLLAMDLMPHLRQLVNTVE